MGLVYSIIMAILFFIVLPLVLGQLWNSVIDDGGVIFMYLSGFFTVLAIFQLVGVPMVFAFVPLHIQVWIFSAIFIALTGGIILWKKKQSGNDNGEIALARKSFFQDIFIQVKKYFATYSVFDWIYFIILLGGLGVIFYHQLFYDIGNWRSDDGIYVVLSSAAVHDDGFYLTATTDGSYIHTVNAKYGLCGIYVYYAYASVISGLGVAIVEQTICSVMFLAMAYGAFYMLSTLLFHDKEDKDNRMIFIIFISLAFLFGMYSRFSLTFRLLGPIWQGKAILATVMTPYLFAVMPRLLGKDISKKRILFGVTLSLAIISYTIGGIIAAAVIPGILTLVYLIHEKKARCLIYLPAMWGLPILDTFLYLILK